MTDLPGKEPVGIPPAKAPGDLRTTLIKLDWRQGSLLCDTHVQRLKSEGDGTGLNAKSRVLVVTHDCDLLHGSLDLEPVVECLIAAPVKKLDGRFVLGKNPRILQFNLDGNPVEVRASNRIHFPREQLTQFSPSSRLQERELELVVDWLTKRYNREAFPNSFEARIDKAKWKEITTLLADGGQYITGIYLLIVSAELSDGEPYDIAITGTVSKSDFEDRDRRDAAQITLDRLAGLLRGCKGIVVSEANALSESQVSIDNLHYLKRWDFDDLSSEPD